MSDPVLVTERLELWQPVAGDLPDLHAMMQSEVTRRFFGAWEATLADKLAAGEAQIDGSQAKLVEFLSMMDTFEFWFNIVTP